VPNKEDSLLHAQLAKNAWNFSPPGSEQACRPSGHQPTVELKELLVTRPSEALSGIGLRVPDEIHDLRNYPVDGRSELLLERALICRAAPDQLEDAAHPLNRVGDAPAVEPNA